MKLILCYSIHQQDVNATSIVGQFNGNLILPINRSQAFYTKHLTIHHIYLYIKCLYDLIECIVKVPQHERQLNLKLTNGLAVRQYAKWMGCKNTFRQLNTFWPPTQKMLNIPRAFLRKWNIYLLCEMLNSKFAPKCNRTIDRILS